MNVAIVGATGYGGIQAVNLLKKIKKYKISFLGGNKTSGSKWNDNFPFIYLDNDPYIEEISVDNISQNADFALLCLPNGLSSTLTRKLLDRGLKVIDLSADYRLKDTGIWKEWYGSEHLDKENLRTAIYGLTELNTDQIKKANLIAVPGCYPTASILGLLPLTSGKFKIGSISIDAKSGISGAGRSTVENVLKTEIQENFRAYATSGHRHLPEIKQVLQENYGSGLEINFLPHLIPAMRGIYATIHVNFVEKVEENFRNLFYEFYKNSPNILLMDEDEVPEIIKVSNTNNCQIGVYSSAIDNQIIIISAIDNLVKGAAGQAMECYNLLSGNNQLKGLDNG